MTDLEQACADLTDWLPALAAALSRDNAPSDGRSAPSSGSVVNIDVLHAMITLNAEIPAACATASGYTGEPWHNRPLPVCLRAIPRFRDRLENIGRIDQAKHLDTAAARWTTIVKFALGLRTPDIPVGYDCPLHDDPFPLVMVGAEGFLRDDRTVLWQHAKLIRCGHCDAEWPGPQWLHLGRILNSRPLAS